MSDDAEILGGGIERFLFVAGSSDDGDLIGETEIEAEVGGIVALRDVADDVFRVGRGERAERVVGLVGAEPLDGAEAEADVLRAVFIVAVGLQLGASEDGIHIIDAQAEDVPVGVLATDAGLEEGGERPLEGFAVVDVSAFLEFGRRKGAGAPSVGRGGVVGQGAVIGGHAVLVDADCGERAVENVVEGNDGITPGRTEEIQADVSEEAHAGVAVFVFRL